MAMITRPLTPNGLGPTDTTAAPTGTASPSVSGASSGIGLLPPPTGPSLSTQPGGRSGGSAQSTSTLPPIAPPSATGGPSGSSSPAPSSSASTSTLPNYSNSQVFGGGWNQFATTPGTPQYGLAQQFAQGNFGQTAVDNLNQDPSTSGIEYLPGSNEYGVPGGYYVSPNPSGSGYDLIQRAAGDNGQSSSSSSGLDLSGLLTALLSNLSGTSQSTQNAIASEPAPAAPATAATTATTTYGVDPTTGLLYGLNPATGQFSTPQSNPVTYAPGAPMSTTQANTTSPTIIQPGQPGPGGSTPGGTPSTGSAPGTLVLMPNPPTGPGLSTMPSPGGVATVDPTTGLPVVAPPNTSLTTGGPGATALASSTNPFTDQTQQQLWNMVEAALQQTQNPTGVSNPQTTALQDAITQLAGQLSGPAFTDQQLNDIRTSSMDSIQSDEDNAVQAEIQRQELLGQSPTSGTVTDSVNKIKAAYTTLKGQAQQADNMYELNTVTQRQQELLQTLNLGATTATNDQQLGVQNAVTGAELSTLPVNAEDTALTNAETVNNSSGLSQFLSTVIPLMEFNQQSGQQNAMNNSQLSSALGQWLASMFA